MPRLRLTGWIVTIVLTTLLAGGLSAFGQQGAEADQVTIEHAWARPAIQGGHGAVYFTLTNVGDEKVVLVGADSDVAQTTEVHETRLIHDDDGLDEHDHHHDHHDHGMDRGTDGGTFIMVHLERLEIGPGEQISFMPAGHHIMLLDLKETLAWGSTFPIRLIFEDGSVSSVQVAVGDQLKP